MRSNSKNKKEIQDPKTTNQYKKLSNIENTIMYEANEEKKHYYKNTQKLTFNLN